MFADGVQFIPDDAKPAMTLIASGPDVRHDTPAPPEAAQPPSPADRRWLDWCDATRSCALTLCSRCGHDAPGNTVYFELEGSIAEPARSGTCRSPRTPARCLGRPRHDGFPTHATSRS